VVTVGGLDLTNTYGVTVAELNIYEDCESPTGSFGDIFVIDGNNAIGNAKINGSETVIISYTANDFNSTATFVMSQMQGVSYKPGSERGDDGYGGGSLFHKEYTFKLSAPEFTYCQGNYIKKDYNETPSAIVQDIVTSYFRAIKPFTCPDQTINRRKMTAQYEHPLKFLNRVIDESVSSHPSSLYVLYATRTGDSEQFVYETYENAMTRSSGVTLKLDNALKVLSTPYAEKIIAIHWIEAEGFYRPSRVQNKSYVVTYDMQSGDIKAEPPTDSGQEFKVLGQYIYTAAPSQTTGVPVFLTLSGENNDEDTLLAKAKKKRLAYQSHLVQDKIEWQCLGNPNIRIGSVITLIIPDMVEGSENPETQVARQVLVTKIAHKIRGINMTPRYIMICEGIKAAYATQSPGPG